MKEEEKFKVAANLLVLLTADASLFVDGHPNRRKYKSHVDRVLRKMGR